MICVQKMYETPRVRPRFGTVLLQGFHAKLANLAERRVLSAAVRSLHQELKVLDMHSVERLNERPGKRDKRRA